MDDIGLLRQHVIALLRGGQSSDAFDEIVGEFPPEMRGKIPDGAERSPWQVLAHMHIAQADILEFCTNPNYKELNWPDDYWPREPEPSEPESWDKSISMYLEDRAAIASLVTDPERDLFAALPWGNGRTLLREALLAADHQSYHLGQLVLLRRLLG